MYVPDDYRPGLLNSPTFLNLDEPSLYQFNEADDDSMVPDFAFLGSGLTVVLKM